MNEVIFSSDDNVKETSKESYKQVKDEGIENSQARQILDKLREAPIIPTANELNEKHLEIDIPNGRVHARLNKLKDMGKVKEAGKREDQYTGRESMTWYAVPRQTKKVEE